MLRKSYPGQFAQLTGRQSLFQMYAHRVSGDAFLDPTVVTKPEFSLTVIEQPASGEITPRAALGQNETDLGFSGLAPAPWATMPDISIDYAVMEGADYLCILPCDDEWSELGGWGTLGRDNGPDVLRLGTSGAATAMYCAKTRMRAESPDQQLVAIEPENIVAKAIPEAVLVADGDRAQDVRLAGQSAKTMGLAQAETLPRDNRPWGCHEGLLEGARFQVKRIVAHPGADDIVRRADISACREGLCG